MGRRLKKKGKKGNIYGRGLSLYVEQSLEEIYDYNRDYQYFMKRNNRNKSDRKL